jgi:hypothetical protein
MFEVLRDVPVAQMATVVCVFFVGITWLGAIFIRPIFRLLIRPHPDLNTLLGNFVWIYGLFYAILMGLLAAAAYQNKADVEQAINSEATSLAALFRNVSAYPETVRKPMQESIREYTQFVIDSEWPVMRQGEFAGGGMPLINRLQEQISGYEPATSGQYILHQETTRQFYRFFELRAARFHSATTGIPGIMGYVVILGALVSIFLVWLFNMSLIAQFLLGGLMSFFIVTMISLILVLHRPLRGWFGVSPEVFQLLLGFINKILGRRLRDFRNGRIQLDPGTGCLLGVGGGRGAQHVARDGPDFTAHRRGDHFVVDQGAWQRQARVEDSWPGADDQARQ